jgi:hypothetical protein
MVRMAGSKDLALILTAIWGGGVVPGITGDVLFGLDGTDRHPQINVMEIKMITRIAYLFIKKRGRDP